MLNIKCLVCGCELSIEGYTTPDSFMEPGEVIIEDMAWIAPEKDGDLCEHLIGGHGDFEIVGESYRAFDDDVL